jgi:hypothetical protein
VLLGLGDVTAIFALDLQGKDNFREIKLGCLVEARDYYGNVETPALFP